MDTNNPTASLDQLRANTNSSLSEVKQDAISTATNIRDVACHASATLKSDLEHLLQSAKASGKAELAAAADRLSGYVSSVAATATELQQKGREQVRLAAQTTDTYVHDNPWQSIAVGATVGAAVGFALGFISTRR